MKTDDAPITDVNITSSSSSSSATVNCETGAAAAAGNCSGTNSGINTTNIVAQNPNSLLTDHYVLLMKKANTLELTLDVIRQSLEASGMHVFGELLHMPNVQAVSNLFLLDKQMFL